MTEKDVAFVNLPAPEMAGALARATSTPPASGSRSSRTSRKAVPDGKLLGLDSDTPNFKKSHDASPDIVIISKKLVDEYPSRRKKLTLAMFKGSNSPTQPRGDREDGRRIFPQRARRVLEAIEDVQIFRPRRLARAHEAAFGADAVSSAMALRQRQDPERARRLEMGECRLHPEAVRSPLPCRRGIRSASRASAD